jgi:hypothetical protein
MHLKEIKCKDGGSIQLVQDNVHWQATVNTVMNLQLHKQQIFLDQTSDYHLPKDYASSTY